MWNQQVTGLSLCGCQKVCVTEKTSSQIKATTNSFTQNLFSLLNVQNISWIFPYVVSSSCTKSVALPLLTRVAPRGRWRGAGSLCGSTALSWGKALPGAAEDTAAEQKAVRGAELLVLPVERPKNRPVEPEMPARAAGLPDSCPTGCDTCNPRGVRMESTYPRELLEASHTGGIPADRDG